MSHDVPDVGLAAGRIEWVGYAALRLEHAGDDMRRCPQTDSRCVEHARTQRPPDAAGCAPYVI